MNNHASSPNVMQQPHEHPGHGRHDHNHNHDHGDFYSEMMCHFPYAVFSVAFALGLLGILTCMYVDRSSTEIANKTSKILFHIFHFMHLVFAGTGTIITFARFSRNMFKGLLVGIFSPVFFCILSDIIFPYVGGVMLGVPMKLHICFGKELINVVPFLVIGVINGLVLARAGTDSHKGYGVFSHVSHILVSSLASMFYLVSHGFSHWHHQLGPIFLLLIIAVVIPCTVSDVVVPFFIARADRKA